MDKTDTVVVNLPVNLSDMAQIPSRNRDNRNMSSLNSRLSSGMASAVSIFCIGLVSGAAGGLLLAAAAVVLLQSVELLAHNKRLMEQLEDYYYYYYYGLVHPLQEIHNISQKIISSNLFSVQISVLLVVFGQLSSTLSLVVGITIGSSTYAQVIKIYSEAVMGKALGLAGSVCLIAVTATGCCLDLSLRYFVAITSRFCILECVIFASAGSVFVFVCHHACLDKCSLLLTPLILWLSTPMSLIGVSIIHCMVTTRLILIVALFPMIMVIIIRGEMYNFQLHIANVALILIITDVFDIAGWPVVSLQFPAFTKTSSAVVEEIFVGVLTSQMFTVAIGMSLFVSWQRGGAGKICVSAAGSGFAVLGVIKLALPVLGPGPTIAALTGVTGAVGVSLAAARAITDQYRQVVDHCGWVGRLGVTVGAAAGAFMSSCVHGGLSGTFISLSAATIAAGIDLERLFFFLWEKFQISSRIILTVIVVIWFYFTGTIHLMSWISTVLFKASLLAIAFCLLTVCLYLNHCLAVTKSMFLKLRTEVNNLSSQFQCKFVDKLAKTSKPLTGEVMNIDH